MPRTLRHFLDAIKFEHTVFALPFAYVAMVLAAGGWPGWRVVVWVTLAMAGARTLAMSVNRLADRLIDAANPRTAMRHLPTGLLAPRHMLLAAVASGALLALSGVDAQPALSQARALGRPLPDRLLLHQALHLDEPLDPRLHRRHRGRGRLDRRDAGPSSRPPSCSGSR